MTVASTHTIIIVGAGLIGPRHAKHVQLNRKSHLFAIIDPQPQTKRTAVKLGTSYFPTISDLINYCDRYNLPYPDGAIVCTPNHTHVTIGLELASYGIHLLVEKPIAMNTTEAKLLQEYTTSQNIKVLVGHHRRFNPYIVATKRNLSKCGKIIAIQGTWTLLKPDQYFIDSPWRTTAESGGVVAINLVHDIDLLQYLFGPIFRIYAEPLSKQRLDHDADEGCVLTINFHSGIMGTFICSDNVASPINFEAGTGENPTIPKHENLCGVYRIFGTKGTLSMPDMTLYHQKNSPSWTKSVNEEVVKVDCGVMPFDLQLNHFVDVIEGKEDPKCCIEDGISALLCIKAVMKSMEIGMPVEVEST